MPTLLMRLVGPMQSWGTTSRFDERDTGKEPSKSAIIGLLAAAMGIDRESWIDLEPLARLAMCVRHDRPGIPKTDYQTAGCATSDTMIKASGAQSSDGVVSTRHYLADAAFLVALEGQDLLLLSRANESLKNPVWPLGLGRKSYVPSESIWIHDVIESSAHEVLATWPWLGEVRNWRSQPQQLLMSFESVDGAGAMRMDQPLSSFAERRFGARFVSSKLVPCIVESVNAAA